MLSEWYKKARLEEGRREGRQMERAEWLAWRDKLDAWERRREEAMGRRGSRSMSLDRNRPDRPNCRTKSAYGKPRRIRRGFDI